MLELALTIIEKLSLPAIIAIIVAYLLFDKRLRQELSNLGEGLRKEFRAELSKTEQELAKAGESLRQEFKQELGRVEQSLRQEFRQELAKAGESLRQEFKQELGRVEQSLRQELAKAGESLRQEFNGLKSEVESLKSEVSSLRVSVDDLGFKITGLERGVYNFSSTLLQLLRLKEVLTNGEVIALHGLLRTLYLTSSSKHYTKEVAKRLWELINKNLDDYTWQDTLEMIKIADILREEFLETGEVKYIDYSIKLRMFAALVQGRLMKLGKGPKPSQLSEFPQK